MTIPKLLQPGLFGLVLCFSSCGKNSTDPGDGGGTGAPSVVYTSPADGATRIPVNADIVVTFSGPMDGPAAAAALSASPAIGGVMTWDAEFSRLTWNPDFDLVKATRYTVTVGMAAKSKIGTAMAADRMFSFTTASDTVRDTTADTTWHTGIMGKVVQREDAAPVSGANVVLYNADNNNPLQRTVSDALGRYLFRADPGNYYLGVSAMGRIPAPAPGGRYTPFRLDSLATYTRNFALRKDTTGIPVGALAGRIEVTGLTDLAGILVVALASDSSSYTATTGPDGVFVFNNLPAAEGYTLVGYRSGLAGDTLAVQATVTQGVVAQAPTLRMSVDPGRALQGQVQFLAATNISADITLVDPNSRLAIPGLRTFNQGATNYRLEGIPPGNYIAWGSYLNDGYVMDPDHIRKFGLPEVTFLASDTLKVVDFAFTRAIEIIRPTNPPDTLYPAPVLSLQPWFVWKHEASAQEVIIEVYDSKGECIWGGWDSAGTIRHAQILARPGGLDSVQYDFDGSAKVSLSRTDTYSWKVYADGDRAPGIQKLISATEDLRGLFMPGRDSIPVDDDDPS